MNQTAFTRKRAALTAASRLVAGAMLAALLTLTPNLGAVAASGQGAAPQRTHFQDDESAPIVPSDDTGDPYFDRDHDHSDGSDNGNHASESDSPLVRIHGIVSSSSELLPHEWAGALDSRLIEPCVTPARPVRISAGAIGLDTQITVREIVNGEMQTPEDEFEVS